MSVLMSVPMKTVLVMENGKMVMKRVTAAEYAAMVAARAVG